MADPIYKDANEHIKLLASDYKCYDNTLTHEEAVELCNMLETKTAHWIVEAEKNVKDLAERIYEQIAEEADYADVDRKWYFEKVIQYMRAESEG